PDASVQAPLTSVSSLSRLLSSRKSQAFAKFQSFSTVLGETLSAVEVFHLPVPPSLPNALWLRGSVVIHHPRFRSAHRAMSVDRRAFWAFSGVARISACRSRQVRSVPDLSESLSHVRPRFAADLPVARLQCRNFCWRCPERPCARK